AEPYNLLEPEFEKVVRRTVRRGTLQVHLHLHRQPSPQDFQVNAVALRSYLAQLRPLCQELGLRDNAELPLGPALAGPGVVQEPGSTLPRLEEEWPLVERVLGQALTRLQAMRVEEGRAMAQELLQHRDNIALHLGRIRDRSPHVAGAYRDRLL